MGPSDLKRVFYKSEGWGLARASVSPANVKRNTGLPTRASTHSIWRLRAILDEVPKFHGSSTAALYSPVPICFIETRVAASLARTSANKKISPARTVDNQLSANWNFVRNTASGRVKATSGVQNVSSEAAPLIRDYTWVPPITRTTCLRDPLKRPVGDSMSPRGVPNHMRL